MADEEPRSPWAEIVGPCYTESSVARTLSWTSEMVKVAVESLSLLELETDDGALLYPAFQIADGRIVDGVGDVLRALAAGTRSAWTWAQWLNTSAEDETGEETPRAIDELRAGRIENVLLDARNTAAAWMSDGLSCPPRAPVAAEGLRWVRQELLPAKYSALNTGSSRASRAVWSLDLSRATSLFTPLASDRGCSPRASGVSVPMEPTALMRSRWRVC